MKGSTATIAIDEGRLDSVGLWTRFEMTLPPLLALAYPFILGAFNGSITRILAVHGAPDIGGWIGVGVTLPAAFGVSIVALLIAMKLTAVARPTIAHSRAKKIAFAAVAAPTLFVFAGVVMYMVKRADDDRWIWSGAWALALLWVAIGNGHTEAKLRQATNPAWLRVSHGFAALGILLIFLTLHLTNHLFFVTGQQIYTTVMHLFRGLYRSNLIQPLLVGLFLFQTASGLYMVSHIRTTGIDHFRTCQIASGVFLSIYVIGHMDSVFIYARTFSGIDSGWEFATGAPAGLLKDAWNIRLVPHYGLGVFFVLSHLFAGARMVMLNHRAGKDFANGFMVSGSVFAAAVALFIMLGMCGVRLTFALP
jgi:hypothetical protein